jgi:predicted Zn-dependent protease
LTRPFLLLFLLCLPAFSQNLLTILNQELDRNFSILKEKADPKPYFLAYEVTSDESHIISCTLGAVVAKSSTTGRYLDVTLRVGSPKLDNYHTIRGDFPRFTSGASIPLDDVAPAIRQRVWLDTDRAYRQASQRLIQIQSGQNLNVKAGDQSDDFSLESPQRFEQTPAPLRYSEREWEGRIRAASSAVGAISGVLSSNVTFTAARKTSYLLNTEGTRLEFGRDFARVVIVAEGKAADGMDLSTVRTFEASDPARLPSQADVVKAAKDAGKELEALLAAPAVEPYVGPAILSGRAAGVFFHEIFGHRVEGFRQKSEEEGQTFTKSVGKSVLPPFLSVDFDPTRQTLAGMDLNGYYLFDDEGVKARPVKVVEDGILKTFLMSRAPIESFSHSNGHGRRQPGREVVSRQSNLIVESKKQVSSAELRKMLLEEVQRQKKPYGLYFADITGGFTTTQRRGLQAFTVIPLVVYRVYADGRPDELVRGVSIVGTPLASFAKIMATGDKVEVFNGYCGAESGSVPVSAASPALLLSEIEVQKKERSQDRPPFLPRPVEPQPGDAR